MKKIERLNEVCGVLSKFISENKGCLDEKGVGEVGRIKGRLTAISEGISGSRVTVAASRSSRDVAFRRLKSAILTARNAMQMVATRDGKTIVVPRLTPGQRNPTRISGLATDYIKALENAGNDPSIVTAFERLKSAQADFLLVRGTLSGARISSRMSRAGLEKELKEMWIILDSDLRYVAGHVSEDQRKDLYSRIRAALPRSSVRTTVDSAKAAPADATKAATPPGQTQAVA